MPKEKVKIPWNKWWTFTVTAAAIGIIALILEYLGYLDELGIIIAGVSLFAAIVLGLRAATGAALESTGDVMKSEHKEMVNILKEHTEILKENTELLQEIRDLLKK